METHAENDNVQQPDTVDATSFLHDKISILEARVEELVEQNERDRTEYQEREDWLKKKIDTQALMLEDKRSFEVFERVWRDLAGIQIAFQPCIWVDE